LGLHSLESLLDNSAYGQDGDRSFGSLEVRIGLHTGECELLGNDIGGIAARVAAVAGADEVLVSSTVKDRVAGSQMGSWTGASTI